MQGTEIAADFVVIGAGSAGCVVAARLAEAGASVVVIPYLFFMGDGASTTVPLILAISLALIAMVVVGGVVGRLSGRGVVFSAARQLLWGAGAALVTYAIGSIVGIQVG